MSATKKISGVSSLDNIKPMPNSIKYGIIGLLMLVMIILWIVFSSGDGDDHTQALVDIESPIQNLKLEVDANLPASIPVEPFAESKQDNKLADEPELPLVNKPQIDELKLTQLENQLNQLILENNGRQQDQDQLMTQLQNHLIAQTTQIEQLQTKFQTQQLAVKVKKRPKPYKKPRPRFTLVSIDQWGDQIYAVVRFQGQLYELSKGLGLDNWQVYSIDRLRGTVMFKNKAGTLHELFVKS